MPSSSSSIARGGGLERWEEPAKFLPVIFVVTIIWLLYGIFMSCHALPMVRDEDSMSRRARGGWQVWVINVLTLLIWFCYGRCVFGDPGSVPEVDDEPSWAYKPQSRVPGQQAVEGLDMHEKKRTGDARHCKWCAKYKPDRCHHCRVCRRCVLKMDHHCPWIYNCVGFANHKFFFLLLVYSCAACLFISYTMPESVSAMDSQTRFLTMFALLFGETLAVMLAVFSSLFLLFHIWLMMRGMTTIEFCEKSMRRSGYDSSAYDMGRWANVRAVLGEDPWLWLVPISTQVGNGLEFVNEETRLSASFPDAQRPQRARKTASPGTGSAPCSDADEDPRAGPDNRLPGRTPPRAALGNPAAAALLHKGP